MASGSDPSDEAAAAEREREQKYRRRLYRLMSDPELSSEAKRYRLLELGRERLDLENGHIVDIDEDSSEHRISTANGSDIVATGAVTDLSKTFCRETIQSEKVLTVGDATDDAWADDPVAQTWDIRSYIGNRVLVGDHLFGTVCFVDSKSRPEGFSATDQSFVTLLSSSLGRLLERDRHDEALREEKEWFELFVSEVDDYAVFMLDPVGHVASWNDGAERIKGYQEDEILDEHVSRFYTEDDRRRGLPERLLKKARRSGHVRDEGWRVRKGGSRFWALVSITALCDDDGGIRGFGKVVRDLTERRNARQELRAEQELFNGALNALDDLFYVLTPAGEIERVNQQVLDVTGYTESEVLSMDLPDFFVSEDREPLTASVAEILEVGESTVEATLLTKGNQRRRYEFRGRQLTDEDGDVTGIVGIARDITEQTLYRERLAVSERVLRHNLRNELNAISGWAEVLDGEVGGEQQEAVDRILRTVDRITELSEKTNQMATLETALDGNETMVDVVGRSEEIVAEFRETYPAADVELDWQAGDDLVLAATDRFDTAVRNTVENAIEHNPADEPWVEVAVERDDSQARVHVHDDGPELPEIEQDVLERGTETALEHGSGLGLWLIHWCVTTAGGEVSFADREPRGKTVSLSFPLHCE